MEKFLEFRDKWDYMPMQEKIAIAIKTDELNNKGSILYNSGSISESIKCFEQALEIMPINDDALPNLVICYKKVGLFFKIPILLSKLYIVNPTNVLKKKIIAFALLSLIIDNYEDEHDMGIVGLSELIEEIKEKYNIETTDDEIMEIYDKINEQYSNDILTWGYKQIMPMSSIREKYYSSK